MPSDLRCPGKRHAILIEPSRGGVIEVKCDSRICGAQRGIVVLHRFSTESGDLISTNKFKTIEGK